MARDTWHAASCGSVGVKVGHGHKSIDRIAVEIERGAGFGMNIVADRVVLVCDSKNGAQLLRRNIV